MEPNELEECKIKKLPPETKRGSKNPYSTNDKLKHAIDELDGLRFTINIKEIKNKTHVDEMRRILPVIVKNLKVGFVDSTGNYPWED